MHMNSYMIIRGGREGEIGLVIEYVEERLIYIYILYRSIFGCRRWGASHPISLLTKILVLQKKKKILYVYSFSSTITPEIALLFL